MSLRGGKTLIADEEVLQQLRQGNDVSVICATKESANHRYDVLLRKIEAASGLALESNMRSRLKIYTHGLGPGTLTIQVLGEETKGNNRMTRGF